MPSPFESLAGLDKLVHEPARLAILTALSGVVNADFVFLERLTGLTTGNLSTHLTKLEAGGLIEITKQFKGKKPATLVQLTDKGHTAIDQHWAQLQALHKQSRSWPPWPADK